MNFPLKHKILFALFIGCGLQTAMGQCYYNAGTVTTPPQIDASCFLNEGTFDIFTSLPFDASNVLNWTNRGTMTGSVGWRFDTAPSGAGTRKRAVNFVNEGDITSNENNANGTIRFTGNFATLSYLLVQATNITSVGSLSAGPNGLLKLEGNNINLQGGSLLSADSVQSQNTFTQLDSFSSTNFFNDNFVTDLYWGVGTNGVLSGAGNQLFLSQVPSQFDPNFFNFGSGPHEVIETFSGFTFTNTVSIPSQNFVFTNGIFTNLNAGNYRAYAFVTQATPSSRVVQVVFVSTNAADTNLNVDVRFSPQGIRGARAMVQLSVADIDVITGDPLTNFVYFGDSSAPASYGTNVFFYQDNRNDVTYRPNPYDVTTASPFEWFFNSQPANTPYDPILLYDPTYASNQVDYVYAGYSVAIGPRNATTNFFGAINAASIDPTNSLGRIEILGGQLDLNLARMRSQGLLTIKSDNFMDLNQGAKMDAQQINIDLKSTNQIFVISNLLSSSVKRMNGQLNAWSAVWSNQMVTASSTNNDRFHVLILENLLTSSQATTAYGFVVHATNQPNSGIVLVDNVTVNRNLIIDSDNVTVKGGLVVPGDLGATNMPRTVNFTNDGFITIPGVARFTKASGPYTSFVNHSNITASGMTINAARFDNSGLLLATGGSITVSNLSGVASMTNGQIIAYSDINLQTDDLRVSNSIMTAGSISTNFNGSLNFINGSIVLTVGNKLTDGGSNVWEAINGVQLLKAASGGWSGDLLGTRIKSTVRTFGIVQHSWSGDDRGAFPGGYTNNAALGWLTLDGYNGARFRFFGPNPSVTNAIYVDYLDLKNFATNYAAALSIDPNFRIYFADSNVPAEKLNGTHTNRLIWVRSYAGQYSGTNVVINGQTNYVNRALVTSDEIDSDGDGTANSSDASPFDGPTLSATLSTNQPPTINISWQAAANTVYTVEYAQSLGTNNVVPPTTWQFLTNRTSGPTGGAVSVQNPASSQMRYYRVRYTP